MDSRWLNETVAVPRDHWLEVGVNRPRSSPDISSRESERVALGVFSEAVRLATLVTPPLEWRMEPSALVVMPIVLDPRRLCDVALLLPI